MYKNLMATLTSLTVFLEPLAPLEPLEPLALVVSESVHMLWYNKQVI